MTAKSQDSSPGATPGAVADPSSLRASPISLKWLVANVALLSIASLAIGYLWLLSYARAEGIPLRVHGDGMGALMPWIAGTAAALLATPAAVIAMTAAMMRFPMLSTDASLHDYLRRVEWKGSADPGAMRMRVSVWAFGVPMLVAVCVFFIEVLGGWVGRGWAWFYLSALAMGLVVFPFLRRGASRVAPMWSVFASYILVLLFVAGLALALPLAVARTFSISADGPMLLIVAFGVLVWWVLVTLIAFGKEERIHEDIRGLVLGSAAVLLLLSSVPDIASNFAAASLRAMGLGGMVVDLKLRADPSRRAGDGLYKLVLDTGTQLYLRPCDATSEQRGVGVIAWTAVDYMELQRNGRCPARTPVP